MKYTFPAYVLIFFSVNATSYQTINIIAPVYPDLTTTLEKMPADGTTIINYIPPLASSSIRETSRSSFPLPATYSLRQKCTYIMHNMHGCITKKQVLATGIALYLFGVSYCSYTTRSLQKKGCWSLWKRNISLHHGGESQQLLLKKEFEQRYPHKSFKEQIACCTQESVQEMHQLQHYKNLACIIKQGCALQNFVLQILWQVATHTITPFARFTLSFSPFFMPSRLNILLKWIHEHAFISWLSPFLSTKFFLMNEKLLDTIPERIEHLKALQFTLLTLNEKIS